MATGADYATDFNDITVGTNSQAAGTFPGLGGTFDAVTGWDHPTGWGTPKNAVALITGIVSCAL